MKYTKGMVFENKVGNSIDIITEVFKSINERTGKNVTCYRFKNLSGEHNHEYVLRQTDVNTAIKQGKLKNETAQMAMCPYKVGMVLSFTFEKDVYYEITRIQYEQTTVWIYLAKFGKYIEEKDEINTCIDLETLQDDCPPDIVNYWRSRSK